MPIPGFRAQVGCDLLHRFPIRNKFNLKSKLRKQALEALVQRLPLFPLPSHPIQVGQVYLIMIRMKSILREDGLVRGVHGAERANSDIRMLFGEFDDLVQYGDICCALSVAAKF